MPSALPDPIPAADLRCAPDEGIAYRRGVYRPLPEGSLSEAPDDPALPRRGWGPPFRVHDEVPRVPRLAHLLGPSVIALGMGLGAGEFLLWPNLVVVNGFSIWWLFWVGVLTQYVVIVEIERWTIATGESVFAGMARLTRRAFWPWCFVLATFVSFFWPGWASQSAEFTVAVVVAAIGVSLPWQPVALAMLLVIYVGLAGSRIVYNALERFEIGLVLAFFPLLLGALAIIGVSWSDVAALVRGALAVGTVPEALLTGAQFPTLLVAVAYAGSGGTLLLAQSLWLRDKGFGMAAFQGRIAGIRGENEPVSATGFVFDQRVNRIGLARFHCWMRVAERELLVIFGVLIVLSVVVTTLVVAGTLGTGRTDLAGNLTQMVTAQAAALAARAGTWLEVSFLLGGVLVLFSTQVGIMDTIVRIAGTVTYERLGRQRAGWTIKRAFLVWLTLLTLASCAIVMASWQGGEAVDRLQPDLLVVIGGPITIASMYLYTLVIGIMNTARLPVELAPGPWRRLGLLWAAILWGWFTAEQTSRVVLGQLGAPGAVIEQVALHPVRVGLYGAWLASVGWFAWRMFRRLGRRP